jgi:SAM-dependent methyltransferase
VSSKYDAEAEGWSERAYADAPLYLRRRADLVVGLGPRLVAGDRVLDLACGDGGLGEQLLARGLAYAGVDASTAMVAAARERLGEGARLEVEDLNAFVPAEPVAAATCFRAIYYARDRPAFFRLVAGYTEKKLVFDLNPRQYRLEDVRADLRAAGFDALELRPFFVPQTVGLPPGAAGALEAAERVRPVARLLLSRRFTYVCAGFRTSPARR